MFMYMYFFLKKRPVKAKIFKNWNVSFWGGYVALVFLSVRGSQKEGGIFGGCLSFRGTNLSFHF